MTPSYLKGNTVLLLFMYITSLSSMFSLFYSSYFIVFHSHLHSHFSFLMQSLVKIAAYYCKITAANTEVLYDLAATAFIKLFRSWPL